METADLAPYKVLLLTYEGQKTPTPKVHEAIAKWVKAGGALVVIDNDQDPFNAVREWWNTGDRKLATPRDDLFDALGVARDAAGATKVGNGVVLFERQSPAALSHARDGADHLRDWVHQAMSAIGVRWEETGALVLRRGPYVIAAGLDEAVAGAQPVSLHGRYIPLFDAALPLISDYRVEPGSRAVLVDVDDTPPIGVVAAACRVRDTHVAANSIDFSADGLDQSRGIVCVKIPAPPRSITFDGKPLADGDSDFQDGLLRIRFTNHVIPGHVAVAW